MGFYIETTSPSNIMATKQALIAFLENRVSEISKNIARDDKQLQKYKKSNDESLIDFYTKKIAYRQAVKNACECTIYAQKQLLNKGK